MRQSRVAALVLVCFICVSALISKISNIVEVNHEFSSGSGIETKFNRAYDSSLVLGDKPEHLLWFVQVKKNLALLRCVSLCLSSTNLCQQYNQQFKSI
jgi:hypothetical protein